MSSKKLSVSFYALISLVLLCFGLLLGIISGEIFNLLSILHYVVGVAFLILALVAAPDLIKLFFLGFKKNLIILFLIFIIITFGSYLKKNNLTFDFTKSQIYSLDLTSQEVLGGIKQPLKFFIVDDHNSVTRSEVSRLLKLYQKGNSLLSYQFVDLKQQRPRKFINVKDPGTIYLEYGAGEQAVVARLKKFSEAEITNAIKRVTDSKQKVAYYAFGHGEPHGDNESSKGFSGFTATLNSQNYILKALFLSSVNSIPKDATMLILAAASKDYAKAEQEVIKQYFLAAGKILILADPEEKNDFSFLTKDLGLDFSSDVVIDTSQSLQGAEKKPWRILINNYSSHGITKNIIAKGLPLVFDYAGGLKIDPNSKFKGLIESSDSSWQKSGLVTENSKEAELDFNPLEDKKGPVVLAASYQDAGNRIVVFSDLDWLRNKNINYYANQELLVNSINWLSANENETEAIQKYIQASRLTPLGKKSYQSILSLVLLLPEIFLLLVLIYRYRRRREEEA